MPDRVALFATCVGDLAAPGPARAAVEVLEQMGVTVEVPAGQSCCGQPALNSGFPREAAAMARCWVATFEPFPAVVTVSGSCAGMVRHHYERILDGEWRRRASALFARTWEFTQFVAAYGEELRPRLEDTEQGTVTYHDSCHMLRNLGERQAPRDVLAGIGGVRLCEMRDPDICCGFGGTFSVKFPEVSTAMADRKLDQGQATGARYLVSADAGCLLHLSGRARARTAAAPAPRHIAELLRDALAASRGQGELR
ncbi:(Fe-S)-binding protein [Allosalinactinospora lopnorensis]|uniref:(Fe-S)-binding protein n=1 Tax=Allosalinactinospora lopnorensis TaxID=1352348 RepID=UPI000623D8B5|nr:(Fe-S)-binding protein [Allosalinactinospora lopnorensis]